MSNPRQGPSKNPIRTPSKSENFVYTTSTQVYDADGNLVLVKESKPRALRPEVLVPLQSRLVVVEPPKEQLPPTSDTARMRLASAHRRTRSFDVDPAILAKKIEDQRSSNRLFKSQNRLVVDDRSLAPIEDVSEGNGEEPGEQPADSSDNTAPTSKEREKEKEKLKLKQERDYHRQKAELPKRREKPANPNFRTWHKQQASASEADSRKTRDSSHPIAVIASPVSKNDRPDRVSSRRRQQKLDADRDSRGDSHTRSRSDTHAIHNNPEIAKAIREAKEREQARSMRDPKSIGQLIALERLLTNRQNELEAHGISPPYSPSIHENPLLLTKEQKQGILDQLDDIEEELDFLHQTTVDIHDKVAELVDFERSEAPDPITMMFGDSKSPQTPRSERPSSFLPVRGGEGQRALRPSVERGSTPTSELVGKYREDSPQAQLVRPSSAFKPKLKISK